MILGNMAGGITGVIVDYLQLIEPEHRKQTRNDHVEESARACKRMAREFACPVIALSQLNRAVEQNKDRKPRLSDLRDSGGIEQAADVVLFIHGVELQNDPHQVEIIIAKQRGGPKGSREVMFFPRQTRFDSKALPWQTGDDMGRG